MSETDWIENTQQLDRKCPLCGGTRTRFGESYSDGEEWVEYSVSRQECKHCGLGCKHWGQIDEIIVKNVELRTCVKSLMTFIPYEKPEIGPRPSWITKIEQQAYATLGKE